MFSIIEEYHPLKSLHKFFPLYDIVLKDPSFYIDTMCLFHEACQTTCRILNNKKKSWRRLLFNIFLIVGLLRKPSLV